MMCEKTDTRMTRRMAGYLKKRIAEARFKDVPDARDTRGKRWPCIPFFQLSFSARLPAPEVSPNSSRDCTNSNLT